MVEPKLKGSDDSNTSLNHYHDDDEYVEVPYPVASISPNFNQLPT